MSCSASALAAAMAAPPWQAHDRQAVQTARTRHVHAARGRGPRLRGHGGPAACPGRRDGRAARALRARGAGELFHVDLRKVAREPENGGWRARGHSLQLHGPGPGLPQGARHHRGARDGRHDPAHRYGALNAVLGGVRHHMARVHPSLQPPAERQGRADEPHAGAGMAVREALTPSIDRYNWDRSHGACGKPTPMPRIVGKKQRLGTAPSSQNA